MIARWMIVGFVLWAVVTLAFRFLPEDAVAWSFMILPFAMFALTSLLLNMFKVDPSDRAEAASIFSVPGLLIGVYEINSFQFVFPNLDASHSSQFTALMFASCAAVIFAGVVSSRLQTAGE
jgi:hypothetical protein